MPIKIIRKDRLSSEEWNDISFLSKEKYFSDENDFFLSTAIIFHVMIELGRKNSWNDHIRTVTERAKISIRHFCNHVITH